MAIFPYHDLNWPDMPAAIAQCYIQRYLDFPLEYGDRWKRLDSYSSVPGDPGAEVYEAAESTVRTYFSDEQWFGDENNPDPVLVYSASVTGQDWLNLAAYISADDGFLRWRNYGNHGYPTSTYWESTQGYVFTTWVVWRMHQLLISEQLITVQELNWREGVYV